MGQGQVAPDRLPANFGETAPDRLPASFGADAPDVLPAGFDKPKKALFGDSFFGIPKVGGAIHELSTGAYRYGGTPGSKEGTDCSGAMCVIGKQAGINLPRTAQAQFTDKRAKPVDRKSLQPGDLVFFGSPGPSGWHVGIYQGNGKFLHQSTDAKPDLSVGDLNKHAAKYGFKGARRYAELSRYAGGTSPQPGLQEVKPKGFIESLPKKLPVGIERALSARIMEGMSEASAANWLLDANSRVKTKFLTKQQENDLRDFRNRTEQAYRQSPQGQRMASGAVQSVDDPTNIASTAMEVLGQTGEMVAGPAGRAVAETGAYFLPPVRAGFGVQAGAKAQQGKYLEALIDAGQSALGDAAFVAALKGGKIVSKGIGEQIHRALIGKNASALERAIQQAEKSGVNRAQVEALIGGKVPQKARTAPQLPKTAPMTGGVAGSGRRAAKPPVKALPANASGAQYEVAPVGKAPPSKTSTAPKAVETPKVGKEPAETVFHGSPHKFDSLKDQPLYFTAEDEFGARKYANSGGAGAMPTSSKRFFVDVDSGDIVYEQRGDSLWHPIGQLDDQTGQLIRKPIDSKPLTPDEADALFRNWQGAGMPADSYLYQAAPPAGKVADLATKGPGGSPLHNQGAIREVLGDIDPQGNPIVERIVNDAKEGIFHWRDTSLMSVDTQKGVAQVEAWKIIADQLKKKGYVGIRFADDGAITRAYFDKPTLKSRRHILSGETESLATTPPIAPKGGETAFEVRKLGQGQGMTPEEIAASRQKLGIQPPKEAPPIVETPTPPKKTFTGPVKTDMGLGAKRGVSDAPQASRPASTGLVEPNRFKKTAPAEGQRVANASANVQRNAMGLESLKNTPKETVQKWADEAQSKGLPSKSLNIATRILDDKNPFTKTRLSDTETAGIAMRLDELDQQFNLTDPKNVEELQRIVSEVDTLTQATKKAGTEWGREGVARQTWFKSNYFESGLLRRFVSEGGGAKEAQVAKKLGSEIAQDEAKLSTMKAQAGMYVSRGERIKGDIRAARSAALNRMKERYGKGGSIGSKKAGAINLDIVEDLYNYTKDIGIIVRSVIQEGAVTLGQALPRIKTILAEAEINVSDETIQRILAGEYERVAKETTDAAKALQNLRKEAKSTTGAQRAQLERRIRETEARIKSGPNAPKAKTPFDKSLRDLEIELMAKKVEADTIAAELRRQRLAKDRSVGAKVYQEIADISRSVVASSDLSAPFNQGMFALAGHPIASAKAGRDMVKALKSEEAVNKLIAETRLSKRYNEGVAAGLEVHGTRLGRGEEFFTSQLVNNLPIISHSERAYTAYLNKLRMDMFENLVNAQEGKFMGVGKRKKLDIEELKQTAEYVNTVTGVGTGFAAQSLKSFNKGLPVMFAPGYMVSRWKTALGTPLINAAIKKNPRLATAILKDYAAFAGMVGGTLYAAKTAGLDVDLTPEKFGRIKMGSVEVDPFGSIFSPLRLLAKVKASPKSAPDRFGWYMFGKGSPAGRTAWDLSKGENFNKDPVGFANWDEAWNLVKGNLPIQVQQQIELSNAEGLTDDQKKALRLMTILGLNLSIKDAPAKGR